MASQSDAQDAPYGTKMIEIKVRFFTNDLAPKGKVLPKEGWTRGVVRITPNGPHAIESGRALPFNSLMELPAKIEQLLIANGIKLHTASKMEKYIVG
jgi:hypothetical protein